MEGECGACTVIVDGIAQRSCLILAGELEGRVVETIEGIGAPDHPHPIQKAFLQAGAVQCGYCTPGMIMSAKALLDRNDRPTPEEIVEALAGNICRCTGYSSIIRAVGMAAAEMRGDPLPPDPAAGRRHPSRRLAAGERDGAFCRRYPHARPAAYVAGPQPALPRASPRQLT